MNKKTDVGFTLIELLVVISIISLLSSIILASLNSARMKARNAQRTSEIGEIVTAFNLGLSGTNALPPTPANWVCASSACTGGWSVFTADAGVDAFLAPGIPSKPVDPLDSTRGYSGYLYNSNWGGGVGSYDGTVFPAGAYLTWTVEPPVTGNSCGAGHIWAVDAVHYIQCLRQL